MTAQGDCYLLRTDERGWLVTEPKFEVQNLLEVIKSYYEENSGEDQRYILKTYENLTDTNLSVTFSSKYAMLDELKKNTYYL